MNSNKKLRIPYQNTTIAPERTKAEIDKLLREHGITDMQWTTYQNQTTLKFLWRVQVKGLQKEIMFQFVPPMIPSVKRSWTGNRYEKVHVNLEATAYRLLWHYLKNKLEAVRWGLESMEKEFLSHALVQLPDNRVVTVGDEIEAVLETVRRPALEDKRAATEKEEPKVVEVEFEEREV